MKKILLVCLLAASAAYLSAGDMERKLEFTGFGGGLKLTDAGNNGIVGGSVAYGVSPYAAAYGEYSFSKLRSELNLNDFQGGVKFNIHNSDHIEPYALLGMGVGRITSHGYGDTNFGLHVGGGARIYASSGVWGIAPEMRYTRYFTSGNDANGFRYTVGIFYQWGR